MEEDSPGLVYNICVWWVVEPTGWECFTEPTVAASIVKQVSHLHFICQDRVVNGLVNQEPLGTRWKMFLQAAAKNTGDMVNSVQKPCDFIIVLYLAKAVSCYFTEGAFSSLNHLQPRDIEFGPWDKGTIISWRWLAAKSSHSVEWGILWDKNRLMKGLKSRETLS